MKRSFIKTNFGIKDLTDGYFNFNHLKYTLSSTITLNPGFLSKNSSQCAESIVSNVQFVTAFKDVFTAYFFCMHKVSPIKSPLLTILPAISDFS